MIARAPILKRGMIAAADEAGLALQATNGPWDSNLLIYQRVVYVVMQTIFGTHPTLYGNSLLANADQILAVLSIGYDTTSY